MKAKIGMRVKSLNGEEGKIVAMTEIYCIFEDDDGSEWSYYWEEVGAILKSPSKPTV